MAMHPRPADSQDQARFPRLSAPLAADEILHAGDGYRLSVYRHQATGSPRGVVACLHGIQSHAGWYLSSCRALARAGFEVWFMDRRGSGQNAQDRGGCPGAGHLIDDVARFLEFSRRDYPRVPLALVAISWGGKLAAVTLARRPRLVDALVLVCPGFFAKVAPSWRQKLGIGWSALVRPQRLFDIPLSDPALFTQTPHWQEFLRTDPLSLHQATARLLLTSRRLDRMLAHAPGAITVPALLMLAGQDRIIDNVRTRAYFARFASRDKTVREYPQAHHTLEFEPDPSPIFADLVDWLSQRLGK